jgi:transglutaminase-like putative cysteine protease
MLIRSEYDIRFRLPKPTTMIAMLRLHPSVERDLEGSEDLKVERIDQDQNREDQNREIPTREYIDSFGNRCLRFQAPMGTLRLSGTSLVRHHGNHDDVDDEARQHPVEELPDDILQFLLSSRYCELDRMSHIACELFGAIPEGWQRAVAIQDWVHDHVRFDYKSARPTKTALDVFTERVGVCRDFQHLAITLTRAMNIPARYATGYLGDIRVPYAGPGDFSAWYQVYLGGRWWTLDARHNTPRIGRLLMAVGRDATDVAITTSFGSADLIHFHVESNEVTQTGERVSLPVAPAAAPAITASIAPLNS